MTDALSVPARPWRTIAHEVTHESNPKKVAELLAELNRALALQMPSHAIAEKTPSAPRLGRVEGVFSPLQAGIPAQRAVR